MSKKKRVILFDDLVEVAARLPWWLAVIFAITSYFVFHQFSIPKLLPPTTNLSQLADAAKDGFVTPICMLLQYVVPVAFLFGAGISSWNKTRSKSLFKAAKAAHADSRLRAFSWREFETLVGESFRQRGFKVKELGGNGPDGGVDLELSMGSEKYFVQCKHWKTMAVGVAPVRELFGVMAAEGAIGGFVVASGTFTPDARKFAEGRSIELINASTLLSKLPKSKPAPKRLLTISVRTNVRNTR